MVYLLHFDRRYWHAGHYVGWARSAKTLPRRIHHHEIGQGARLTAVVSAAGIGFQVARVWPDADRHFERRLKDQKHGPRLCPLCNPKLKEKS